MMAKLPGLGPRSARRAVLHLIKKRGLLLMPLADADARRGRHRARMPELAAISAPPISARSAPTKSAPTGEICVVEDVADLWAMERASVFKGRYHVLGGTLSALDAVGPDELRIPQAGGPRRRPRTISEVILALNATIDGQTTAHYIADQLEGRVTVTSLAQGVPIGGELDYLDDGTISAALQARKSLSEPAPSPHEKPRQSMAGAFGQPRDA